jgi:hypothetical protein
MALSVFPASRVPNPIVAEKLRRCILRYQVRQNLVDDYPMVDPGPATSTVNPDIPITGMTGLWESP